MYKCKQITRNRILRALGDSESDFSEPDASELENFCRSWLKLFPLRMCRGDSSGFFAIGELSFSLASESLEMAVDTLKHDVNLQSNLR